MAERFYYERPSAARKAEIIEYLNEFAAAGSEINGSGSLDRILSGWTFEQALERCLSMENKEYAEKMNRCPGKTFLLIRENDNRLVGTVNVRWDLNEEMLRFGGHIGYGIRPSERRKGYNKINLYLALKEAKKIGLDRVMIDCAASNIASDKTIQALGGILERCEKDPADDEMTNVYWINVEEALSEFKAVYEPYISASAMAIQELTLKDLQPSQFYISEKKLHDIEVWLDPADLSGFEPIPVKILDGIPVMTDGHTRAAAALRAGLTSVPLVADEDDLDWEMYRACVNACRERNIFSPEDLLPRIIPEQEYQEKWDHWCDILHAEIRRSRITVKPYTEQELPDVLDFERRLREEEDFWGWEIDEQPVLHPQFRGAEHPQRGASYDRRVQLPSRLGPDADRLRKLPDDEQIQCLEPSGQKADGWDQKGRRRVSLLAFRVRRGKDRDHVSPRKEGRGKA